MQIDSVNAKKDDLTTSIKSLSDITKQLVRAYSEHVKVIDELQKRIGKLENNKI